MKRLKLFPYQKEGLRRVLERPFSFLFMEPGTGKTAVAIRAMEHRFHYEGANRVVIFVPNTIKYNWQQEIPKFMRTQNYSVFRMDKNKPKDQRQLNDFMKLDPQLCTLKELRGRGFQGKKKEASSDQLLIIIANYEKARIMEKVISSFKPQQIIVDELHKLRNRNAGMSKAIYRIAQRGSFRVGLTGTPVCKGYEDLFMQYRIIDNEVFGNSYPRFEDEYIRKGGYMGHEIIGYKNVPQLKRIIKDTSYRVKLSQVTKLPPIDFVPIICEMGPIPERVYSELAENMFSTVDKELARGRLKALLRNRGIDYSPGESYFSLLDRAKPYVNTVTCELMITQMLRLQQVTGGFVTTDEGEVEYLGSSKLGLVTELLSEEGPTVVVCRFVPEIELIMEHLKKHRPRLRVESYRDTKKRDQIYSDFQEGKVDVLIIQASSGSVGLNLQRASTLILYSYTHSYDEYYQTIARIKRQGQVRSMRIYTLMVGNSIDEDIMSRVKTRERLSRKLIG